MPLPQSELEALKVKLAKPLQSNFDAISKRRNHIGARPVYLSLQLVDGENIFVSIDLTPTQTPTILAAAVNEEQVGKAKKFVSDVEVAVSRRSEIYNFNEVLEKMADTARALLRELEGEVGK